MAITHTQNFNDGVSRGLSGSFKTTDTAAAVEIDLGFKPVYFQWLNETDRISYEKYAGMASDATLKTVAAGTRTLDTADAAIVVDGNKVTVSVAAAIQNKQCRYIAY